MAQPSGSGAGIAGLPDLPPLAQPTGELPRIDLTDGAADDTVVVTGGPDQPSIDDHGVFGERVTDAAERYAAPSALAAAAGAGTDLDEDGPGLGSGSPSVTGDVTAALPMVDTEDVDRASVEAQVASVAAEHAPTDPFPRAEADQRSRFDDLDDLDDSPFGPASAAGRTPTRETSALPGTEDRPGVSPRREPGRGGGRTAVAAAAASTDLGAPSKRGRSDRDPADRLQDTEFKLADGRRRQKPKEPNRLVLGLAIALVVLAGAAVAYWLTRDDGDATATDDAETVTADADTDADGQTDGQTGTTATTANPEPVVDVPTLFFEAADAGPLQQGETYSIDLVGEPEGSMLQVVVDDIPQGEPDLQVPDLILPAGRHTILIEITNGAEVTTSTPVEVIVLGDLPPAGYRANLSSVDMETEGWAEAVRQYDEFKAAGHEQLQLAPLTPGYWNIFVGGLGEEAAAAQEYCESFSLAVPDECFPVYFDGGPAGAEDTTATTAEAMTDGDGDGGETTDDSTSTTAAGG